MVTPKREAAMRQLPVAYGPSSDAPPRSVSETRMQAAVVVRRPNEEKTDPNADVPCTD